MSNEWITQAVMDASNGFTPNYQLVNDLGDSDVERTWRMNPRAGVTGLWFPESGIMAVSDPAAAHHDELHKQVTKRTDAEAPMLPWNAKQVGGAWQVEVPTPGGSMWKLGQLSDEDIWRRAEQVSPEEIWPIVHACRRLGVPESAVVSFEFDPPRAGFEDARWTAEMDRVYDELRFLPGGLPDPEVDR